MDTIVCTDAWHNYISLVTSQQGCRIAKHTIPSSVALALSTRLVYIKFAPRGRASGSTTDGGEVPSRCSQQPATQQRQNVTLC